MTAIAFNSVIGPVPIDVFMRESHSSTLGITELPVETGAKITDHSYVEPKKLSLDFADDDAAETYGALVRFQETREPFNIVSGLFVYDDMLIKSLTADRDQTYSRIVKGRCELQQVIIVSTAYAAGEAEAGDPQSTGKPGGKDSTSAAKPTAESAGDAATADKASGTVMRGDSSDYWGTQSSGAAAASSSSNESIAHSWLSSL